MFQHDDGNDEIKELGNAHQMDNKEGEARRREGKRSWERETRGERAKKGWLTGGDRGNIRHSIYPATALALLRHTGTAQLGTAPVAVVSVSPIFG